MPEALPLHGRLVRLEPMSPAHAPGLLRAASEDRSTYGYTYVPADVAAIDRYIEKAQLDAQSHLAVTYTVIRARDGQIAGTSLWGSKNHRCWSGGVRGVAGMMRG
ncbi:GNAT family N-acetyltransferase [Streptomyces sp. NPDC058622]|uniref:GNAT family N-acetyltransferase n=1 Tax=Streptomyces sp. NPDC058622 TaxID=3346562 RepID=UPI00365BF19C